MNGSQEVTAATMLDSAPLEFSIGDLDWHCKLSFKGKWENGKYLFWVNDILVTGLPKAPPIQKDNIPPVCQSDNLVFLGDVIKRTTFQIFIDGLLEQFVADHNARSRSTQYLVNDKIIKQWDGLTLEEIAEQPFTFYQKGQKFVLKWVIADPDSDKEDNFVLESNGAEISTLLYMAPNFKMVDADPSFFDA